MATEAFLEHGTSKPYSAMEPAGNRNSLSHITVSLLRHYHSLLKSTLARKSLSLLRHHYVIITHFYNVITGNNEFIITYYYSLLFLITLLLRHYSSLLKCNNRS